MAENGRFLGQAALRLMKKVDLGQLINTLANLGVIAGIIFLAYEVQQNNDSIEAQIRAARHVVRRDDFLLPLQNKEYAEILIKYRRGEALTEYESLIFNRAAITNLLNLQFVSTNIDKRAFRQKISRLNLGE